jgi:flagellum-specific ATP synthase
MHNVVSREHFDLARRFRAVYSKFERGRDLVQIGAYAQGSDRALDEAIALHDGMSRFLQQDMYESTSMAWVVDEMAAATELNAGVA